MNDYITEFLSMPLWFSILMVVSYLVLVGDIIYVLWQYRGKNSHQI